MLFLPQLLINVKRTMEDVNISAMILKQAMFVPAIRDIHCKQIDIVVLVSFDSYQKQINRLAPASITMQPSEYLF